MEKVLFLTAPIKKRVWGGNYFKRIGRVTSDEAFGELWSASGHSEGLSIVTNGTYKGMSLAEIFMNHPELFNYPKDGQFPILIKLIHAQDALSVQVHPNDEYASKYENQLGKTEGWLILEANNDSTIVLGHKAKNVQDLKSYINSNKYEELLNEVPVKKGQFFPIYAGTIHAIGKNITILEIQQSSDVTYRFYDYHRKDKDGNERELHVDKACEVTSYNSPLIDTTNYFSFTQTKVPLWDNEYFSVCLMNIKQDYIFDNQDDYQIVSIVSGEFLIDGHKLVLGDSFILTHKAEDVQIMGDGRVIVTTPKTCKLEKKW